MTIYLMTDQPSTCPQCGRRVERQGVAVGAAHLLEPLLPHPYRTSFRMNYKAKQIECDFGSPEAFTLKVETTLDGDRVSPEKAQRERELAESESKQRCLDIAEGSA